MPTPRSSRRPKEVEVSTTKATFGGAVCLFRLRGFIVSDPRRVAEHDLSIEWKYQKPIFLNDENALKIRIFQ
jgi:hypothetical protein